ncbi:ABC transporter permease [Candidatus Woesearchaeota archaeon]|nr:ABC transporter permease [Candidatus Woesearchaeota archaeon]
MNPVLLLAKNHVRTLVRSRATVLTVLAVPLILLLIAGFVFDTNSLNRVRVGVWSSSASELSESIISTIQQESVTVHQYDTQEECVDAVKQGDQQACLAFVGTFARGASNTLNLYIDPSRTTLMYPLLQSLESALAIRSDELGKDLATSVVTALQAIRETVELRKGSIVTLTTSINGAGHSIGQLATSITPANVSLNASLASEVVAAGASHTQQVDQFLNATAALAEDLADQLEAVDFALNASTLSNTSKQSLRSQVANASAFVDDLVDEANVTTADLAVVNLTGTLEGIAAKLAATKAQIDAVAAVQGSLAANLHAVKSKLDASLLTVAELQKGFNDITAALEGVTVTDPDAIAAPVKTVILPVTSETNYRTYAFPFLMVIVLLFSGLLVPPLLMLAEQSSPAALRVSLLPIKPIVKLQAFFLASLAILGAQSVLMLIVAGLFLQVFVGLLPALLVLLVISAVMTLIGMLVGLLVSRELLAVLTSILIGVVLLVLSDFIIPLDTLPRWFSALAQLNPAVIGGEAIRSSLLFGDWGSLLSVGALIIVAGVLAVVLLVVGHALPRKQVR